MNELDWRKAGVCDNVSPGVRDTISRDDVKQSRAGHTVLGTFSSGGGKHDLAESKSKPLSGIGNNNLFLPVGAETGNSPMAADEGIQTNLVIGIHENGIDP